MKDLPIIYSPKYNLGTQSIAKLMAHLHSFDIRKYGKVHDSLKNSSILPNSCYFTPEIASKEDLLLVHSEKYLKSLKKSLNVAKIVEIMPLAFIPNLILKKYILTPMLYATSGTIKGLDLALEHGYAVNLGGGYHHAKANKGEGFCIYADIPIAIKKQNNKKILVVDLDAHQGNGIESILSNDPNSFVMDMFNASVFPKYEDVPIDFPVILQYFTEDEEYLKRLEENLEGSISSAKPDAIIYNAGTDIYVMDPLGGLNISKGGIIKRDEIVFRKAIENNIPILMVPSGGYTSESHNIISSSIKNIVKKV